MKTIRSVLIVDDNQADIEIASYFLNKNGNVRNLLVAEDGKEALSLFEQFQSSCVTLNGKFPPRVILLDINMPKLNGFEFLERYAELNLDFNQPVVILMLTSSEFVGDIEKADNNPLVQGYITKPFSREKAIEICEKFGE
ncbi:response regulator [Pleionea sp. CnH1-48]|uniref:response regulator n=1 Tax=Pleionea sp. CnH1-48 TaxID=2954494 RepID=UPI0020974347|nr:response regulator [Pleionea sp. CnH1-48]MCO7224902.1 response regulator [Pleionea sp. CnH1-48]